MHSIRAIAANTIKQALRMKLAAVFIVLLFVLLAVMGVSTTGDGTLKGRLQTFVSYSLSLTSLLLCLFTLVASVYTLTSDFEHRQIYTVLTKPVRRFELLLGKLFGVVLLDIGLLILFSAVIYFITINIPRFSNASEAELLRARNEFYTARASLKPAEPDVSREVTAEYDRLDASGQLPADVQRERIIARLTKQKSLARRAAVVGHDLVWSFNNVKPLEAGASLFVRFKYEVSVNPSDLQVFGRWVIGDDRQLRYGGRLETPLYDFERKDLIRTFHELEVPADAIAADGYLAVGFLNVPLNNTVVIFPLEDGLEVLYKAGTFGGNFLRAVILILFRLIFLACLGVLASSFLSFPVAMLLCLSVFFTGTISGFLIESFDYLSAPAGSIYSYTVGPLIRLLPQFDKFTPAKFLVPGRLLSWSLLAKIAGLMLCVKAFLLFLLALLIFSYREIAKIVV
jgi:hypothetical protein